MDNLLTPEEKHNIKKEYMREFGLKVHQEHAELVNRYLKAQLQKLYSNTGDLREEILSNLPAISCAGCDYMKSCDGEPEQYCITQREYADNILPLIIAHKLAAVDKAVEKERERIANETYDYFVSHMPQLVDTFSLSGIWQRIFKPAQSLGEGCNHDTD